ncbi:hypothetical protein B0T19DRAFT_396081 [Cercophora scortea]|uniref:Uncharacterized protein n=1 Tax=Cercophora scortea TaxID=314031 RepID=A0AAE0MLP3_9PEZI|nr:hypothetical protein B0T19DRAFT_396081 [Cercophora scortea]
MKHRRKKRRALSAKSASSLDHKGNPRNARLGSRANSWQLRRGGPGSGLEEQWSFLSSPLSFSKLQVTALASIAPVPPEGSSEPSQSGGTGGNYVAGAPEPRQQQQQQQQQQ